MEIVEEVFLEQEGNDDWVLLSELAEVCGSCLRCLGKGTGKITFAVSYADGVSRECSHWSASTSLFTVAEEIFHIT